MVLAGSGTPLCVNHLRRQAVAEQIQTDSLRSRFCQFFILIGVVGVVGAACDLHSYLAYIFYIARQVLNKDFELLAALQRHGFELCAS